MAAKLPRPGMVKSVMKDGLSVLLLSNSANSLTKRIQNRLELLRVNCNIVETRCPRTMETAITSYSPHIVVCPFLTAPIPESIYSNTARPCLIVHPGVPGDRGASSIDWALHAESRHWGVTVLQAEEEMDAGPIWSTTQFPIRPNLNKTSLYVGEISDAAVECVMDALSRFSQDIPPVQLDYSNSEVIGRFRRNAKVSDRIVNWRMPAEEIVARVRMADTQPGALAAFRLGGNYLVYRMFDAHLETGEHSDNIRDLLSSAQPGDVVGQRNEAVLVKAGDENGIWIGQLKQNTKSPVIKLPALTIIGDLVHDDSLPEIAGPCDYDDIRVICEGKLCYIHFEFYNGAMNKRQAARLEAAIQTIAENEDVHIIVLMGGERFFSTGIHLCCIENSEDKYTEAWENISKIDDVIHAIAAIKDKLTVAVLQGNAGAGGAMMAVACDIVVSHPGVLLSPSYKSMQLFGSEYWTFFLPRRIGRRMAEHLTRGQESISAEYAVALGMIDKVFGKDKASFVEQLPTFIHGLLDNDTTDDIILSKQTEHNEEWFKHLHTHRSMELDHMRKNFKSDAFLAAMKRFVYKLRAEDPIPENLDKK